MDTRQLLDDAVLLLLWAMVLWRAPAALRAPTQRALWLTFAALTLAMTLRLNPVMHAIDEGLGVVNLSTLLKHVIGITAAAALLEFVYGITRPDNPAGRRLRLGLTGGTLLALTVFFALTPRHTQADDFFEAHVGQPAATAYLMVWFAYLGAAMAIATALFWGAGRHAGRGWLRTGLWLLGAGTAAGVLYAATRAGYLLLRLLGIGDDGLDAPVTEATDLLKHAAIVLILLGTSIPAAGVAWRGWHQWRHLRALAPLWREFTEAVPEVVLDEELKRIELRLRLHRTVVEIRDALLALQPYSDGAQRAAAEAAADEAGATGARRRQLADACWAEAARRAKLAGRPAGSAPPRDPVADPDPGGGTGGGTGAEPGSGGPVSGSPGDIDAEARWLRAFDAERRSATVRRFVAAQLHAPSGGQDPAPAPAAPIAPAHQEREPQ